MGNRRIIPRYRCCTFWTKGFPNGGRARREDLFVDLMLSRVQLCWDSYLRHRTRGLGRNMRSYERNCGRSTI